MKWTLAWRLSHSPRSSANPELSKRLHPSRGLRFVSCERSQNRHSAPPSPLGVLSTVRPDRPSVSSQGPRGGFPGRLHLTVGAGIPPRKNRPPLQRRIHVQTVRYITYDRRTVLYRTEHVKGNFLAPRFFWGPIYASGYLGNAAEVPDRRGRKSTWRDGADSGVGPGVGIIHSTDVKKLLRSLGRGLAQDPTDAFPGGGRTRTLHVP